IMLFAWLSQLFASQVEAASGTWSGGSANGSWTTAANWNTVPGATGVTNNTDIATFSTAITNTWGNSSANPIVIDTANRSLGGITFTANTGNYFIGSTSGSNSLLITSTATGGSTGTIQINNGTGSNVTETINAPIVMETANGIIQFANFAT